MKKPRPCGGAFAKRRFGLNLARAFTGPREGTFFRHECEIRMHAHVPDNAEMPRCCQCGSDSDRDRVSGAMTAASRLTKARPASQAGAGQ